jgi:hypothetical protein
MNYYQYLDKPGAPVDALRYLIRNPEPVLKQMRNYKKALRKVEKWLSDK